DEIAPRLAPDGYVVSLQNGLNEPAIAARVGRARTVGALVNFGADYLSPGRIFLGGAGALSIGELDGRRSERVERLVREVRGAAKTHSGIYRDLAIRQRKAEPLLDQLDGPLVRRTVDLIHEIEDGRRVCEIANLGLLAAYARCEEWGPKLNAVIAVLRPSDR